MKPASSRTARQGGASLLLCLLLAGCVAAGVQVKPEQLASFATGSSTLADVVHKLGQPTSRSLNADGSQMLIYNYTAYQARPESFIPLIGPLVGGADVETSMVWFEFDPTGTLVNYSANDTAIGSASNLAAPATPQTPAQPRKTLP